MSDFSEVSNSMTNNSVNTLSLKHLPISHSCMLKGAANVMQFLSWVT